MCIALIFVVIVTTFKTEVYAMSDDKLSEAKLASKVLKKLGLYKGIGNGLKRKANKTESLVMYIRLLGEEKLALKTTASPSRKAFLLRLINPLSTIFPPRTTISI